MLILGIESSCDETGVAIYCAKRGLLAHVLHSQIALHQQYGGVVPELASRDHVRQLVPLVTRVLSEAGITARALDAVAYTAGPGLVGALLTGACFAKAFAFGLGIKALAVHHLEAHVLAAQLETPTLEFPFIALLVSGGHTQLLHARGLSDYEILGDTLDDAVGEAFDKTAKLMGIPYPGGPQLAALADEATEALQQACAPFPRPMTDRPGLAFSFSGLKTHALMTWMKSAKDHAAKVSIASAFQTAIVETLAIKCERALRQTGVQRLVVAGGVGANRALRQRLTALTAGLQGEIYFPKMAYCTDNGAMIAYAGCLHLLKGEQDATQAIKVYPRWPLERPI